MKNHDTLKELVLEIRTNKISVARLLEECIETLLTSFATMIKDKKFYTKINELILNFKENYVTRRAYLVFLTLIDIYKEQEIELLFTKYI